MYTLVLTKGERDAFDWVGDRYAAGEIAAVLCECMAPDDEWSQDGDITFTVPEHKAWEVATLARTDDARWPCFSPDLAAKLDAFIDRIV